MPADWISNGPISTPIHIPDMEPDIDLNGMKFNYGLLIDVTGSTNLSVTYKVST
jgi:hypothetical protein